MGYIDFEGNVVVAPAYDAAKPFSEGLAAVEKSDSKGAICGFIELRGEIAIPFTFSEAGSLENDFASVELNGRWVLIDNQGAVANPVRP